MNTWKSNRQGTKFDIDTVKKKPNRISFYIEDWKESVYFEADHERSTEIALATLKLSNPRLAAVVEHAEKLLSCARIGRDIAEGLARVGAASGANPVAINDALLTKKMIEATLKLIPESEVRHGD